MKLHFLILLFSLSCLASPIELVDFMKESLNSESIDQISLVLKNHNDEKKLFHPLIIQKPKKESSLKIIQGKESFSYPHSHPSQKEKLFKETIKTLKYLQKKSPIAKKLIENIKASSHFVFIKPIKSLGTQGSYVSYAGDRCNVANAGIYIYRVTQRTIRGLQEKCLFNKIGSPAKINWTFNIYASRKTNAIALAHELYHAYDMTRGIIDHRRVDHPQLESIEVREYRAVYFENLVRKDLKKKIRRKYSKSSKQDMFLNGKQVWL